MLGRISIFVRKRNPLACMIIHNLLVHTLQLQSGCVLICLINITLTTKSAIYTSEQKTENMEQTEKPFTEATLIPDGSSG